MRRTLNFWRLSTTQCMVTSLPATTVTLLTGSANLGRTVNTLGESKKKKKKILQKTSFQSMNEKQNWANKANTIECVNEATAISGKRLLKLTVPLLVINCLKYNFGDLTDSARMKEIESLTFFSDSIQHSIFDMLLKLPKSCPPAIGWECSLLLSCLGDQRPAKKKSN